MAKAIRDSEREGCSRLVPDPPTVGVFGGSFDPPHAGHVALCSMAVDLAGLDELLVVPCYRHAFGKRLTEFAHRMAMCVLAFGAIERVRVSDLEARLGGTSFTLRTLERVALERPGARLRLVLGADALREKASWHRFDEIQRLAELVVFGREGVFVAEATLPPPPAVSATEVRRRLEEGLGAEGLVPGAVLRYIADHDLYSCSPA